MNHYECEKCGITRPESALDLSGWFTVCRDDPDCRWPVNHPTRRKVAVLTVAILDYLEDLADDCCIDHAVLLALVDCAREAMARREAPGQ